MEFGNNEAIYLQIADYMCECILRKQWAVGAKIPAIRELAVNLQVNPNTVMRSYAYLQERGIIYNQRGIGYYVAENGLEQTRNLKHTDFLEKEAPRLFRSMALLGITFPELQQIYQQYKTEVNK